MSIRFTYMKQPPKKYTFEMPQLKAWTIHNSKGKVLNLFAGKTLLKPLNETRIDMNKEMPADYHMDAFEFVSKCKDEGRLFDTVIFDPPYNLRKSREKYFGVFTSQLRKIKTLLTDIVTEGGYVITYGYDSTGMSKKRGFELIEICLVNHSGDHNDTICIIEKKIQNGLNLK